MDWKEILTQLLAVLPKLAFKPELIDKLAEAHKVAKPSTVFLQQLDVILAVCKQNQRVAELYGYASLQVYAQQVETLCGQLLTALKQAGVNTAKPVAAAM